MIETVKVLRSDNPFKAVVINKCDLKPSDKLCDDNGKAIRKTRAKASK